MNKTININLANTFFHIDEDAYIKLQRYLDAIKRSFTDSQGKSEIIADIEARIAELFTERLLHERQVITTKEVDEVIEKPPLKLAPSNLGIVGRYILEPEIFACLEETRPGALGEIQLTDAISRLLKKQPVNAYLLQGTRFDGSRGDLGLLQSATPFAVRIVFCEKI